MKNKWAISISTLAMLAGTSGYLALNASDHDDGVSPLKDNSVNLTDLFVFREDNQTGNAADSGNLVMIMNSYGHTPPGQQVFFSSRARYQFHITRVAAANKNTTPTGADDVVLSFEFSEPDAQQRQTIAITAIKDGQTITVGTALNGVPSATPSPNATPSPAATASPSANGNNQGGQILTTSLTDSASGNATINQMSIGAHNVAVFAGLRADPFFFDFEQFFRVRAGAAGLGPKVAFKAAGQAVDGFANENVNSIVLRVPIVFLQSSGGGEPIFDVWETVSLK